MSALRLCVVGAGVTGATVARSLAERGLHVDVFEARDHVAGNCHTVWDAQASCYHHVYGPHIFHTNLERVAAWVARFTRLLPYKHAVKAQTMGAIFSLPINLHTLNQLFHTTMTPQEAQEHLAREVVPGLDPDLNFETRALSLLGPTLYQAFFKGYTQKQWGVAPVHIPAGILKRLPLRFNYDDNYFHHTLQGLPDKGYTAMVEAMLDDPHIHLHLQTPVAFDTIRNDYTHIFWSGALEDIFNADEGYLPYRTLEFDTQHIPGDAQGCPVMNMPDEAIPYTRITQHNYLRSNSHVAPVECSLVSREYSRTWRKGDIRYYPVHLMGGGTAHAGGGNARMGSASPLQGYVRRAKALPRVYPCGRLGRFQYLDMDVAMDQALALVESLAL